MKLYTFPAAPNARRLHLFMDYKGIQLDTEEVDMGSLKQHEEPYASMNPLRTVPSLQLDDGTLITEVVAMVDYLESTYPEKPLFGSNAQQRAMVINYNHWLSTAAFMPVANMFRNKSKGFVGRAATGSLKVEQIPALAERGESQLGDFWPRIEKRLSESEWVAGDFFSFADIDLFVCIEFCGWVKQGIPEDAPSVKAWHERASAELS
jgi:glutathione S-transferase